MPGEEYDKIRPHLVELRQMVIPSEILPYIQTHGKFNKQDVEEILCRETRDGPMAAMDLMCNKYLTRRKGWLRPMLEGMLQLNMRDLAVKIDPVIAAQIEQAQAVLPSGESEARSLSPVGAAPEPVEGATEQRGTQYNISNCQTVQIGDACQIQTEASRNRVPEDPLSDESCDYEVLEERDNQELNPVQVVPDQQVADQQVPFPIQESSNQDNSISHHENTSSHSAPTTDTCRPFQLPPSADIPHNTDPQNSRLFQLPPTAEKVAGTCMSSNMGHNTLARNIGPGSSFSNSSPTSSSTSTASSGNSSTCSSTSTASSMTLTPKSTTLIPYSDVGTSSGCERSRPEIPASGSELINEVSVDLVGPESALHTEAHGEAHREAHREAETHPKMYFNEPLGATGEIPAEQLNTVKEQEMSYNGALGARGELNTVKEQEKIKPEHSLMSYESTEIKQIVEAEGAKRNQSTKQFNPFDYWDDIGNQNRTRLNDLKHIVPNSSDETENKPPSYINIHSREQHQSNSENVTESGVPRGGTHGVQMDGENSETSSEERFESIPSSSQNVPLVVSPSRNSSEVVPRERIRSFNWPSIIPAVHVSIVVVSAILIGKYGR